MSGIKVTNERPARAIPEGESVEGEVDDEDVDWEPPSAGVSELDQWKQPVRVATTATITIATALNSGDTIDGVTLAAVDRVLVKDQASPAQNGIYVVGATPVRADDMDADDEVLGAVVYVIAGTANAGTAWAVTNDSATVVGTDPIDWAALSAGTGSPLEVLDEGVSLDSGVTSIDFTGAGVTATNVGPAITVDIPGGSGSLPWYDVTDYGAVGDGTTDDTTAVQDAIDACMTAGGGTVYFPPGIYQISGALQNTGTHNSQLVIPTAATHKSIRFLGWAPNKVYGGTPSTGNESVIRSDWNGSISGNPAIISAGTYHGIGESVVYVTVENLTIVAPDDPKLSALQMTAGQSTRIVNVQIRTTSAAPAALPTHSNAVGLDGPWGLGSIVPDYAIGLDVYGFYTGIVPAEQFHGVDVGIAFCTRAVLFVGGPGSPTYTHYPVVFDKLVITLCPRGLVFQTDIRWVQIQSLSIEHDTGTFASVYDIDDASSYAYGFIDYHVVDYANGVGTAYDMNVTGGTNLSYHWATGKMWRNHIFEIPTGTDPSTNLFSGGKLYAASGTGDPMWRDSAGTVSDLLLASAPWLVQVNAVTLPAYNNTNFGTLNLDTGELLGGDVESTGAQNAEIEWRVTVSAGTWSFDLLHYKGNNRGIYTVSVDGSSVGTIDGYAAGATKNVVSSINSIVLTAGMHVVKLKMATKNASSASYYGTIQSWQLRRTS